MTIVEAWGGPGWGKTRMPSNWTAFVARCGFPKVQVYFLPT
ncbi:MAG: hypothetical protein ACXW4M_07870 [Anaerolineales bacterium]